MEESPKKVYRKLRIWAPWQELGHIVGKELRATTLSERPPQKKGPRERNLNKKVVNRKREGRVRHP